MTDDRDDVALRELRAELALRDVLVGVHGPRETLETLHRAEALIAEFDTDDWPPIRLAVAKARVKRGDLLVGLDEDEAALAAFAEAAADYGSADDAQLVEVGADARRYLARLLWSQGRHGEAMAALRQLVATHEDSTHPGTRHTHALAQIDLATWLGQGGGDDDGPGHLQRVADAWGAVVASHGASDAAPEAWAVVDAVRHQFAVLWRLGSLIEDAPDEAPHDADADEVFLRADVIAEQTWRRYLHHPDAEVRNHAVALLLDCLDRWDEPARVLGGADALLQSAEADDGFDTGQVAKGLRLRAWALQRLGRPDEALAALDHLAASCADDPHPWVRESLVMGALLRGRTLRDLGRDTEAAAALHATESFLDDPDSAARVRPHVAKALRQAADILADAAPPPAADARDGTDGHDPGLDAAAVAQREQSPADLAYAAAVDALVRRFADDRSSAIRLTVARALADLAHHQRQRLHLDAALATHDRLIGLFDADPDADIAQRVASAWLDSGYIDLVLLRRPEAALARYDALLARFGGAVEPRLRDTVAKAATSRVTCLNALGDIAASLQEGEGSGKATASDLQAFGDALGGIRRLAEAGSHREVVEACDRVVAGRLGSLDPRVRRQCVEALVWKGISLQRLGDHEQAVAVFREAVARYGHDPDLDLQKDVALACVNLAVSLDALGRHDEELAAYDDSIARWADASVPSLAARAGRAFHLKGITLADLGRVDEARQTYEQGAARYQGAADPAVRLNGLRCGVNLGSLLRGIDLEASIAAYRAVLASGAGAVDPAAREQVARAHLGVARSLAAFGYADVAVTGYEAAIASADLPADLRKKAAEELEVVRPAPGLKGLVKGSSGG